CRAMPSGAAARAPQIARNPLVVNPNGFFARLMVFRYPCGIETDSHFGNRGRNRLPRPRAGIQIVVPFAEVPESWAVQQASRKYQEGKQRERFFWPCAPEQ